MPESPLPQKRSISIAEPSNAPISPLVLTAENDSALRLDTITEHVEATHTSRLRAKSTPSLSFALADPKAASPSSSPKVSVSTPKAPKASPVVRLRGTSPPPPARFENRVSFDNVEHGDPTEHNTISFTLNVKHEGYQYKRQSRTFMVGVDDNPYSNIALQFVLQELIDDGDQIVCIRVVDKEAKIVSDRALETKKYRQEANTLMEALQKRNGEQRALNIILEFAVGKLEDTFLKMLEIYNPAMLIVGTRGRSLGGIQGLMANRNSFSKWCLQFCSVPVVVVRPTEKRMKKKLKRGSDPARRDYVRILRESGIETHETEAAPSTHQFEASNSPHLEAHAVAVALGLPGQFDPTITPIDLPGSTPLRQVDSAASAVSANTATTSDSRSPSPNLVRKKSPPPKPAQDSEDESGDDEDDEESSDEFEAVPGVALLGNADKQKKLHDMEVGEAAALAGRKNSIASVSSGSGGSGKGEVVVGERKLSIGSVSSGSGISGKSAAEEEEEKTNEKEDSDEKQDEGSGIEVADKGIEKDEGEKDAGEKDEGGKDEEEKNEGENSVAVATAKLEIAGD